MSKRKRGDGPHNVYSLVSPTEGTDEFFFLFNCKMAQYIPPVKILYYSLCKEINVGLYIVICYQPQNFSIGHESNSERAAEL